MEMEIFLIQFFMILHRLYWQSFNSSLEGVDQFVDNFIDRYFLGLEYSGWAG